MAWRGVHAWLELVRLPNVFTLAADVLAGWLLTHAWLSPWLPLLLVMCTSVSLYWAGMVLNDVYDLPADARERPSRPLPSGRITLAAARRGGYGLLLLGVALGCAAGVTNGQASPSILAGLLAVAIVAYDRILKNTVVGPFAMGGCRTLNLLLAMCTATGGEVPPLRAVHWLVAGGLGVYVAGVTWLARREAERSSRVRVMAAMAIMACGMAMLAWLPRLDASGMPELSRPKMAIALQGRWFAWWGVMGVLILWRPLRALVDPSPRLVQQAVRQLLLSLIMLDAVTAFSVRGVEAACIVLLLLIPAILLGRWFYST